MASALFDKLCSREALAGRVAALARPLVFTNGVFDILHRGHVSYLAAARGAIAVHADHQTGAECARTLGKGSGRPLNGEADRACVLAAIQSVDLVTLFDEVKPLALLRIVRPDLYVKGGDYDVETLEETALVQRIRG